MTAILYLEHSGQPLRHVGEQYGLSQTRLHEWHCAIEVDGTLARVMAALKLDRASALDCADRPFHSHNAATVAQVTALRLRNFGDALRAGSKRSESVPSQSAAKARPTSSNMRRWWRRAWRHARRLFGHRPKPI
jgi:hypothetical protein